MVNKEVTIQLIKFGIVGISNTLITIGVFILLRMLGVYLIVANVSSYIAGIINSFCWNRKWVFKSNNKKIERESFLFLVGAGASWLIQWLFFKLSLNYHEEWVAQIIGMMVYTLSNFAFNKLFTFRNRQ